MEAQFFSCTMEAVISFFLLPISFWTDKEIHFLATLFSGNELPF